LYWNFGLAVTAVAKCEITRWTGGPIIIVYSVNGLL